MVYISLAVAYSLLSALFAVAAPTPADSVADPLTARTITWPDSAAPHRARRSHNTPTNAELLKRGLTPSRPHKLYGARSKDKLEERLLGPPGSAAAPPTQPSGLATNYEFVGCTTAGGGVTAGGYLINAASFQELADKCAAYDQAMSTGPSQFMIYDRPGGVNCLTRITVPDGGYGPCDALNSAVYRVVRT